LQVDPTMSDEELSNFVTQSCINVGIVRSVTIHRELRPFALVEMATVKDSLKLAARFGRPPIGTSVLVYLGPAHKKV
jgi:hypothetical protein